MQITGKAVISEIYKSEKTGRQYVSFVDLVDGGQYKICFDGELEAREGEIVEVNATIKGRVVQGGGVSLNFVKGVVGRRKPES